MALASGWDPEEEEPGALPDAPDDEDYLLVDDRSLEDLPEAVHEDSFFDEVQSTSRGSASWQQQAPRPPLTSAPSSAHWSRPRFLPSEQPRRAESDLKSTSIVGRGFAHVFPYDSFNAMQSECFDILFKRDANVVVTAPTGSGKTVLFELALCRLFASKLTAETAGSRKALYLAPLKALVGQRYADWKEKFSSLGITCCEVSGDTGDFKGIMSADIIVATAEKWDSITRKLSKQTLMSQIALVLIDEVHTLNEDRGAVLEAVISRMKLQHQVTRRYIAISATAPNLEDIGEWLHASADCVLKFSASYRPVQLSQRVLAYPNSRNGFLFDRNLNWRLLEVVLSHDDGKPTLVFCTTRKECVNAAMALVKNPVGPRLNGRQPFVRGESRGELVAASRKAVDKSLQEMILNGVGMYHAGLEFADRRLIEELFTAQAISVVCTTSSLAQGVNLPAHLVVVKSTQFYKPGVGYQEYSDLAVLQMIGRAGRPQFDDSGAAVIMTSADQKTKWERLLGGRELIESNLHKSVIEHITAEICRGTIQQEQDVSTFLYVRMRKEPVKYGLPGGAALESEVKRLCSEYTEALLNGGMISRNGSVLHAEPMGHCMTKYYLRFKTFAEFTNITAESTLLDLIKIIAHADEFSCIVLRRSEKAPLNAANKHASMRFPQKGNVKDVPSKVALLMQCALCSVPVKDFSLQQDINVIFAAGVRISRALVEYLLWKQVAEAPLLAGLDLLRIMQTRIWENSLHVVRQIEKIGPVMSNALVSAGITSLDKLESTDPRVIEGLVNRHAPFGTEVLYHVRRIPKFALKITDSKSNVTIRIERLTEDPPAKTYRYSVLVAADSEGRILKSLRIPNSQEQQEVHFSVPARGLPSTDMSVHLVSEDVFGRDVHTKHRLSVVPLPVTTITTPKLAATAKSAPPASRKRKTSEHSAASSVATTATTASAESKLALPPQPTPSVLPSASLKDASRYAAAVNPNVKRLRPAPPPAPAASSTPSQPAKLAAPKFVAPSPAPPPSHAAVSLPSSTVRVSAPTAATVRPPSTPPSTRHVAAPKTSAPQPKPSAAPSNGSGTARPIVDLSAVFADLF